MTSQLPVCVCVCFPLFCRSAYSGPKKNHDSQRRDRILRFFLRLEIEQVSPHFGGDVLVGR